MTIEHITTTAPDGQQAEVAVISGATAGETARLISLPYPPDSPMVFSVWWKAEAETSAAFSVLGQFGLFDVPTEWERVYCANEAPLVETTGPVNLNVDILPRGTNYRIYLYKAQLEQGTIPSDWRVAPEDTDEAIGQRVTITEFNVLKGVVSANVTSIDDLDGRMSSAELKLEDDSIIATVTESDQFQNLETQVSLVPGQISAAVSEVKIGGTNLIRLADGTVKVVIRTTDTETGDVWQDTESHYYDQSMLLTRIAANSYSTSNWGSARYESLMKLEGGIEHTLSFWCWTDPGFPTISDTDDGNPRVVVQLVDTNNTAIRPTPNSSESTNAIAVIYPGPSQPVRYTYTFTIASNQTANLRFNVTTGWTDASKHIYISDVKLELGNKATAWSPHPDELRSGSGFIINKDKLLFYGPMIDMDIVGSEQAFHLDDSGGVMGTLTVQKSLGAPNMAEKYTHGNTVTVGTGGDFLSLNALASVLNNHVLTGTTLTINLVSDLYENVRFSGITGSAEITLNGNSYTIHGTLELRYNTCPWLVSNLTTDGETKVYGGYVRWHQCMFNGPGYVAGSTNTALYATQGARMFIWECAFYNANRLISIGHTVDISCTDLSGGNTTYNYLYMDGGTARLSGTRPRGTFASSSNSYFIVPTSPDSMTSDPPSADPTPPPVPTPIVTSTFTANASGTYYALSGLWDSYESSSPNAIRQGNLNWNGTQALYGTFWFDLSSVSGKTVKEATLTLTRAVSGTASDVTVHVYTTKVSGKNGNPMSDTGGDAVLGVIGNGATETFAMPVALIQSIVDGTYNGLTLNPGDSGLLSGRGYSKNYCRYAGAGESAAPVLTITYQ